MMYIYNYTYILLYITVCVHEGMLWPSFWREGTRICGWLSLICFLHIRSIKVYQIFWSLIILVINKSNRHNKIWYELEIARQNRLNFVTKLVLLSYIIIKGLIRFSNLPINLKQNIQVDGLIFLDIQLIRCKQNIFLLQWWLSKLQKLPEAKSKWRKKSIIFDYWFLVVFFSYTNVNIFYLSLLTFAYFSFFVKCISPNIFHNRHPYVWMLMM